MIVRTKEPTLRLYFWRWMISFGSLLDGLVGIPTLGFVYGEFAYKAAVKKLRYFIEWTNHGEA